MPVNIQDLVDAFNARPKPEPAPRDALQKIFDSARSSIRTRAAAIGIDAANYPDTPDGLVLLNLGILAAEFARCRPRDWRSAGAFL